MKALVPFTVKAFEDVNAPATVNELFRLIPVNRLSFPVVKLWINVLFVRNVIKFQNVELSNARSGRNDK